MLDEIKTRRSIRKFTSEEIDDQTIDKIIEAGTWAPSGLNNQPWKFVVVKGQDMLQSPCFSITAHRTTGKKTSRQSAPAFKTCSLPSTTSDWGECGWAKSSKTVNRWKTSLACLMGLS